MTVTKVVDGDTIYGDVDLGFNIGVKKMEFRLAEVNTPEIKGPTRTAGLESKKFVEDTILNKEVCILTKKDSKEKYGRYLAWVYYKEAENLWINLNQKLVELNLAVPFMV
jgi:micrococcal nuclease